MRNEPTTLDRILNAGGTPVTLAIWSVTLACVAGFVLSPSGVEPFAQYPSHVYAYLAVVPNVVTWVRLTDLTVGDLSLGILGRLGRN